MVQKTFSLHTYGSKFFTGFAPSACSKAAWQKDTVSDTATPCQQQAGLSAMHRVKALLRRSCFSCCKLRAFYTISLQCLWGLLLCLLLVGGLFTPARAFPDHPVEMSIVFSPGDMLDVLSRTLATQAEPLLGQSIVPVNKPGGGGMPGVAELARASADGHHLAAAVSNALILLPHKNKAPYKPLKDVEPVLSFGTATPLLMVRADSPWKNAEQFFSATLRSGGEVRVGVSGLGTPAHLALLMLGKQKPGLEWRFVPFAGAAEVETALLGGHIDAAASGDLGRVKSKETIPLFTLAGVRSAALPEVPSLVDLGFANPGSGDSTFLLLAPAGTPENALRILEQAFMKAAQSDVFLNAAKNYSINPVAHGREKTKAMLRQAWTNETEMLRQAGILEKPASEPE